MDEEADLALLDQHLLKTNMLSQRMTSILGQLDTRLSRLDKTIAPLGIQPLTRKAANIDLALSALSPQPSGPAPHNGHSHSQSHSTSSRSISSSSRHVPPPLNMSSSSTSTIAASSSSTAKIKGYTLDPTLTPIQGSAPTTPHSGSAIATPADETAIITRGPDPLALGEYFGAMDAVVGDLERMWKGLSEGRGGAREAGVRDLSKLIEIGFGGLVQLFLKLAKDSTARTDVDALLRNGPPTPSNLFPALSTTSPIAKYISKLVSPQSPHIRTQQVIESQMAEFVQSLAEIRGEAMKRALGVMLGRAEEVDEGGIWEAGRGREKARALVQVWEVLIVLIEGETLLITTLFATPPPTLLVRTLHSSLSLAQTSLTPTINTIKRAVSSHAFVALDLYQSFTRFQSSQWDPIILKCLEMAHSDASVDPDAHDALIALNSPISTLRQLGLRSFPELLVDIRTAGQRPMTTQGTGQAQGQGQSTSSIADTTYSTLTYLDTLPEFQGTVEGLLKSSQSQRSWLMGQKEAPSSAKSAEEEGGVVNLFVADVLGTLIIHLNQRVGPMRRPIGQAFLLNNLSHIRNTTSSFTSDIIGPGAEDMLNKAFREAKASYLSEWTSLTSLLTSPPHSTPRFNMSKHMPAVPGGSSERNALKEAAIAFFDRLGELETLSAQGPLARGDPDMRDRVGKEAGDMVRDAYVAFGRRCEGKGMDKYLRGSADDVAGRVRVLFR